MRREIFLDLASKLEGKIFFWVGGERGGGKKGGTKLQTHKNSHQDFLCALQLK